MKNGLLKNKWLVAIIVLNIVLIFSVFSIINYLNAQVKSDIQTTLFEIADQNRSIISNKLASEMTTINLSANQIVERYSQGGNFSLEDAYLSYINDSGKKRLFITNESGFATFSNGTSLDLSDRDYFQYALEGIQNISHRLESRINEKEVFVISVPIVYRDKILGTMNQQYTLEDMYRLCEVSVFADKGDMYIMNREGTILFNVNKKMEDENFVEILNAENTDASQKMKEDIQHNRSGNLELILDGEKHYATYTPVEEIYDWYLVSSIKKSVALPNAQLVIRFMAVVLMATMFVFMTSVIYYVLFKRRQQIKLEQMLFCDGVTKGHTHQKFLVEVSNILSQNKKKQYHLVSVDVDNFKFINQFYGFEKGDMVLKGLNSYITAHLNNNELIARMYSDHFIVLLEDISKNRLIDLFADEMDFDGIKIYLSAGVYSMCDEVESIGRMIDKARLAASTIKGIRFKQVAVYSKQLDDKMMQDEQVKRDIEIAILDDEIVPFFQPKVDINSGEIVGAEALARWVKKDGTIIAPYVFIPVCEATGLITSVDMIIFEKTLQFIRKNIDAGYPAKPVSVNFSRLHLLNKEFTNSIVEQMKHYRVPTNLLEVELTETVIFDNFQQIDDFIKELHKQDIKISMDDFGSGYSSLHLLKDIDIDVIKIDRGFLEQTGKNSRQKVIFEAVSQMAKKLNIKLVVEGVETLDNVNLMKEFDCSIAQGYYFAKPMDIDAFEAHYRVGKIEIKED